MMERVLQECGLSGGEAKVYLALLQLRGAMAGEISQKSGIHRRTVYPIIESLIRKGLVAEERRGGGKRYLALPPKRLFQLVQARKQALAKAIPPLAARYEETKDTQVINFFKGKEGVKTVLDDIIIKGEEVLVIGAITVPEEFVDIFRRYRARRVGKRIRSRLLFTEDQRGQFKHIDLDRIRFLPREYKTPATTAVYANKVGIILFTKEPVAISIKVPDIVESYRSYFELLWGLAKD
jgi:sugar-specific transcriptional regulator TrmB